VVSAIICAVSRFWNLAQKSLQSAPCSALPRHPAKVFRVGIPHAASGPVKR
jgi:hypothetical protein